MPVCFPNSVAVRFSSLMLFAMWEDWGGVLRRNGAGRDGILGAPCVFCFYPLQPLPISGACLGTPLEGNHVHLDGQLANAEQTCRSEKRDRRWPSIYFYNYRLLSYVLMFPSIAPT